MIQALIFDLDDTLYPEVEFISGGYRQVARYVSERYGGEREEIYCAMMSTFANYGRGSVLPMVVKTYLDRSVPLAELVEIYRGHLPSIRLYPGYECLLQKLSRDYRLGIITDGNPDVQRGKVRALGLEYLMDKIIYTWDYGPANGKPHGLSFSLMLDYLRADPADAVYVGDNPDKDCRGAHGVGMKFARIRTSRPDERDAEGTTPEPDFVIDSLYQLTHMIRLAECECDIVNS